MELPRRTRGDELLKDGEMTALRKRLRNVARRHDLTTVVACAFDHRTRMLPFIHADMRMAPAGVRAVGAAMLDAGFNKTRIVLQQWNRNFRPSQMKLDGRIPDIFMVSSMQIHAEACDDLIEDACRIDPVNRPLIIAGGPRTVYEPWGVFGADPLDPWGADVACTGEEFVFLSLIEVLLSFRGDHESLRSTFIRARNSGMLDEISGLVYARGEKEGVAEELVDTGIQRLLGDLDELPHAELGYRLLEPPSRKETIGADPVPASRIRKLSPISSLVLTCGCKFSCPYCPIPAYNQRQHRMKSPERIASEMTSIHRQYGVRHFFGTDDNFFDKHDRTIDVLETLSRFEIDGRPIRKSIRWGTEVTVHDTLKLRDHLPLARHAGVRALWLGVEDMTATLVKKGQSVDKTAEAFHLLHKHGICAMPMMMHHDEQPLVTFNGPYGLINQARLLRKAKAVSLQVLMITPATGSKLYEETYDSGMVYESVGGKKVREHMLGGNHVVASHHPQPWKKQFNILIAYLYFYNPGRMLWGLIRPKSKLYLADSGMQMVGMWGLAQTVRHTLGWAFRLMFGKIKRQSGTPKSKIPMRSVRGEEAPHALPGTPAPEFVQVGINVGGATATAAGSD